MGNRNAMIHGLYAEKLSESDLALLEECAAIPLDDLRETIAAMRFVILRAIAALGKRPSGVRLLLWMEETTEAGVRLANVLKAQRILTGESAESLSAAFAVALREIGEELGISDG